MNSTFKIKENLVKNRFDWSDQRWLLIQIILELTAPTGESYSFSIDSLANVLRKIHISTIVPFYSHNSPLQQPENEKNAIISFYINTLGFKENFLEENFDISKEEAQKIASNIIKKSQELDLIVSKD